MVVPTLAPVVSTDARRAARTSIYLTASLFNEECVSSVKVRNISANGALVEAAVVPRPGTLVQLVRGNLIVHGLVAWSVEGRCGLKFSGTVDVQQWRASPTNSEQQRVDEVVRLVKAGAVPIPLRERAQSADEERCASGGEPAGDLKLAVQLLEKMGEALADDPAVIVRFGQDLQRLDIAIQVIAAVQEIISGVSEIGVDETKLAGLRRSAEQALR